MKDFQSVFSINNTFKKKTLLNLIHSIRSMTKIEVFEEVFFLETLESENQTISGNGGQCVVSILSSL